MNDIVIIPSSWRAEFLYLCLEALSKCPEISSKEIWIVQDHKERDDQFPEAIRDTEEVVNMWRTKLRITPMIRPVNNFDGGEYNFLSALNKAYKTDAKYIYAVEDDILVSKDFFKWHEAVQSDGDWFCTIAGLFQHELISPEWRESPDIYFKHPFCRTLGICWKRENLSKIVEHYTPEYYTSDQSMCDYVWKNFPDSIFGYKTIGYDGLISRVMERDGLSSACAGMARARHIGLWGYHRSIGLKAMYEAGLIDNPLLTRIEILDKLLRDPVWLNEVASFQTDINVPLPDTTTDRVFCINK